MYDHPGLKFFAIQGLKYEDDEAGYEMLMECWPDNQTAFNFSNFFQFIAPFFEVRKYPANAYLAQGGEEQTCTFYIKQGEAFVYRPVCDNDCNPEAEDQAQVKHSLKRFPSLPGFYLPVLFF